MTLRVSQMTLSLVRRMTRWAWRKEIDTCEGMLRLKELHLKDGAMEVEFEHSPELSQWIGLCFASMVVTSPNYTEMQFQMHPNWKGERKWITVTVQKHEGKTPHQMRQEAERELSRVKNLSEEFLDRIDWLSSQREIECQQKEAALAESYECLKECEALRSRIAELTK